jgi:glucose/arabinose dehydrogenase
VLVIRESRIGAALSRTHLPTICDDRRGEHRPTIRNLACMTQRRPLLGVLALLCAALLVGSGCARFNEAQSEPFTTEPQMQPGESSTPPPPPPLPPKPFPKVKVVIPVDPSGDGGLLDIVLSPTYSQDRLMYAYVSTPTDNRVIRIADGDVPKPILTGIPKGATGNAGALIFTSPTTLTVQTGDAGNPALAADPASLAGKLLRIEQPTTVNQAPQTTALSGLGAGGGLCIDSSDGSLYITDRTPTADRLQRITKDSKVSTVWTWPDRPGVAGCAASDGTVLVNLINTKQTVAVRLAPETGAVTGDPEVIRQDQHGHVWALQLSPDGNVWGATVNKTSGDAEKLDDVVFPLFPQGGFPRSSADNT